MVSERAINKSPCLSVGQFIRRSVCPWVGPSIGWNFQKLSVGWSIHWVKFSKIGKNFMKRLRMGLLYLFCNSKVPNLFHFIISIFISKLPIVFVIVIYCYTIWWENYVDIIKTHLNLTRLNHYYVTAILDWLLWWLRLGFGIGVWNWELRLRNYIWGLRIRD